MTNELLTYESFAKKIVDICEEFSLNYIEAVLHYCEENDIDVEDIVKLINPNMKERIKGSAIEMGLMKKESTLPIE